MRALRAPLRCRGRKRKRDSGLRRNDEKKTRKDGKKGPEGQKKEAETVFTQPVLREWRGKDAYWDTF